MIVIRAMLQAKEHADEETKYVPKRTRKEILAQREKEKAQEHES